MFQNTAFIKKVYFLNYIKKNLSIVPCLHYVKVLLRSKIIASEEDYRRTRDRKIPRTLGDRLAARANTRQVFLGWPNVCISETCGSKVKDTQRREKPREKKLSDIL